MRIAVFTETFSPKVDGIVNTVCHLLEHLAQRIGRAARTCAKSRSWLPNLFSYRARR